jgi:hypothetical protein
MDAVDDSERRRNVSTQVSDHTNNNKSVGENNNGSRSSDGRSNDGSNDSGNDGDKSSNDSKDGEANSAKKKKKHKKKKQRKDDLSAITEEDSQADELARQSDRISNMEKLMAQQTKLLTDFMAMQTQNQTPIGDTTSLPNRQAIDLPLRNIIYNGTEMTTAPILLKAGDEVYWRYSGDLVRFARILGIISPPNLLQREPIYSIEMQNGQTHSARHDELFITKNKALTLDQNGVIRSSQSITTASDQLDLTAIGESYPSIITQQWANLNPEKFKLATLQTNIKDYKLVDDSIVSIKRLMDFLSSSITGASTTGLLSLPAIMDLSLVITI